MLINRGRDDWEGADEPSADPLFAVMANVYVFPTVKEVTVIGDDDLDAVRGVPPSEDVAVTV